MDLPKAMSMSPVVVSSKNYPECVIRSQYDSLAKRFALITSATESNTNTPTGRQHHCLADRLTDRVIGWRAVWKTTYCLSHELYLHTPASSAQLRRETGDTGLIPGHVLPHTRTHNDCDTQLTHHSRLHHALTSNLVTCTTAATVKRLSAQ